MIAIERIFEYIAWKHVSINVFSKNIGVSNGYLSKQKSKLANIGSHIIEKIVIYYSEINPEWLINGTGDMLRDEQTPPQQVMSQANEFYKELYEKIYEENKALLQKIGKMGGEIEMLKKTNGQLTNEILSLREERLQEQTGSFTPNVDGSERKTIPTRANIADAPFSRKARNPQIEK